MYILIGGKEIASDESGNYVHVSIGFGSKRDFCVIGKEDKIGGRASRRVHLYREEWNPWFNGQGVFLRHSV
jgi:hypothetical protein